MRPAPRTSAASPNGPEPAHGSPVCGVVAPCTAADVWTAFTVRVNDHWPVLPCESVIEPVAVWVPTPSVPGAEMAPLEVTVIGGEPVVWLYMTVPLAPLVLS